ncbi:MAG TPA: pyruvate formate lyase family protein [Candidatus Latescibacteria bacterium]|nr:pyruvate formate lyase family protein [Candidatus Latescibacterota bacterium]HOS64337.1 pyruvate formate lyase family protein [Candidatus Latescibacterota bacterium]HPK75915.1 pyruvate formate lyase family protein [Candidatus Latescibacterota bacterium]
MGFREERAAFEHEFEAYYSTLPNDVTDIRRRLDLESAANPEWTPYRLKTLLYETIARECPVKVFRHFPFFYEIGVGKPRTDLGAGGIGAWLKEQPFGRELAAAGNAFWRPYSECGLSHGWAVLDDNHHSLGYDNVFSAGLSGLVAEAKARLAHRCSAEEQAFLEAMIAGLSAQMHLATRFADEARRMLSVERDSAVKVRLAQIAAAANRVPAHPPTTFFEALATILFMRETTQALEGNGISVYGHLDRILFPFYERDIAEGRLTPDEARGLLAFFLARCDAAFGMREARNHVGTNTTVVIGGCDADGVPVFNEVTRMIFDVYREYALVDPKLNARVSSGHPEEFFRLLAEFSSTGSNVLSIFNDDVIIRANAKMGKAVRDCRLYVGGGCQENVLENTEINSRATMYMSLPGVLLMGFFPERWDELARRDGFVVVPLHTARTFEEFYAAFLRNLRSVIGAHVAARNRTEAEGARYNPCPLHSATISDCIERARDMMAGGARYSFGSVSLAGIGTLIDSLYAVKVVVFDQERLSLTRLRDILAADFEGEEALRQYIVNRIPKFGHGDPGMREFSTRVFADVARACSGYQNTRGGTYEASLFSFRSFVDFGRRGGATPDGRHAGEHLSPGMSPSQLALGRECNVTQVLRALEPVDMTDYPVVAVLDVKMPLLPEQANPSVLESVVRCFVDYGGSVLQINVVDPSALADAREHPERHPDLVVRVSGYSAYFRTLSPDIQQEVVTRALAR